MTDFLNVQLNSKELEFLTGQVIPTNFYIGRLGKNAYAKTKQSELDKMKFPVHELIGMLNLTSSNDPRYDKKEPIMFAVNQIREKGLNRDMREAILSDKSCIKAQCLTGKWFLLNLVLTDYQLNELNLQLKAKFEYHTRKQADMLGGQLEPFINFSTKTSLISQNELKPKKEKCKRQQKN